VATDGDIKKWDSIAGQYNRWLGVSGPNINNRFTEIVTDAVLDLLGNVAGARVLDLGCGEGYLSRILARGGAQVQGIDGSREMIRLAEKQWAGAKGNFIVGDIRDRLPYGEGSFTHVICNMVLMDLEDIDVVFREANRVLEDKGLLVASVVHPCFFLATVEWQESDSGSPCFMPTHRYVEPRRVNKTLAEIEPQVDVVHYHRPIQDYVNSILRAELRLVTLRETSFESDDGNPEHLPYHLTANNLILAASKGKV
jgi:2-polyprenyl-3-methyl-5-hydroxy-6-metoxy-1,4-benzoquinol methylase